jgi:hypothetical protein
VAHVTEEANEALMRPLAGDSQDAEEDDEE